MFTGLVEAIGTLRSLSGSPVARARIDLGGAHWQLVLGESVAVNGACLTVGAILAGAFEADVSSETLARTTLGALAIGSRLHLERATRAGDRLGGHVVLGHIDGLGEVVSLEAAGSARRLVVRAAGDLAPYLATKGSVAIDGVSLTLNQVTDEPGHVRFEVMLVPHTLASTRLGELRTGTKVNLEADVLARYVERQLGLARMSVPSAQGARAPRQSTEGTHGTNDERLLAKLREGGWG
jgi:riboflavin synthase